LHAGDEVDEGVCHIGSEGLTGLVVASLSEDPSCLRLDLGDEACARIGREASVEAKGPFGVGPPPERALGLDGLVGPDGVLF
jgi:hypothetical protein